LEQVKNYKKDFYWSFRFLVLLLWQTRNNFDKKFEYFWFY
jgi:hypothetical protein